ncbi:MAG: DEAD/DEAH box helicase [Actinomycetes bacterium]
MSDLVLLERLASTSGLDRQWSALVEAAVTVWSRPGFDTLVSLPHLRFEPFAHQLATAQVALRTMRGRAILADEVGLGKTIEAGLVLSELRLRGLADRALVVAPAGLVPQWAEELDRKFGLPVTIASSGAALADADGHGVVVASLATVRREPTSSIVADQQWDLVIIDEAHRVRNPRSASGRLARSLRTRFLLLLTATPVENRLDDLFHLVNLVAPGLLGTPAEFRARHGGSANSAQRGPAPVRGLDDLQRSLREVLIRHRRSDVAITLPNRLAETVRVVPGPAEAELYASVAARLRDQGKGAKPAQLFGLRALARQSGSSPAALAGGLTRAGWHDLADQARSIESSRKTQVLLELLQRRLPTDGKVVVFSAFRETLDHIAGVLRTAQIDAVTYHGSLSRADKERTISSFREHVPVMLSTEAAGEGRNLQFCHVMINYDLPWNPMQIEQRLGRLHRIGQQHDVILTNLAAAGTIEDHILRILETKINLFELVIGELDMILGRIEDDFDFEKRVFADFIESVDDAEFGLRLDSLGDSLAAAREAYLGDRAVIDDLVGETP